MTMATDESFFEFYGRAVAEWGNRYLVALALAATFAVIWRIVMTPRKPATAEQISATELAFLRSDVAPVVTALASLRATGRVTSSRKVDHGVRDTDIDGFTGQVLRRVTGDPRHTVAGLCRASKDDLVALEEQLGERGLVMTRQQRTRIRWGVAPSIVVMLLGVGYGTHLVTRLADDPDLTVTFMVVVFATVLYGVFVLPWLLQVKRLTPAGRRLLAGERKRMAYLHPAKSPAFETYGPSAVALSVALFGAGALWVVDGSYADAVQAPGVAGGPDGGGGCGASCGGGDGGSGCSSCGGCGGGGGGCGG
ncbi:hypothetical protein EB74_25410 [Mycobacterium sp. SWH-M5]|nr:hypothetical protein EB74_25410 [Mycobacterium sp. SWH-M5]